LVIVWINIGNTNYGTWSHKLRKRDHDSVESQYLGFGEGVFEWKSKYCLRSRRGILGFNEDASIIPFLPKGRIMSFLRRILWEYRPRLNIYSVVLA